MSEFRTAVLCAILLLEAYFIVSCNDAAVEARAPERPATLGGQ